MSRAATLWVEALEVRPKWLFHVAFLFALLAGVVVMVALRRTDLDVDEDVIAAVVLALCLWVLAIGLGSFVRNVRAGYALRLDARGLHVPGLVPVPWSAVRGAELRSYESSGKRFRQLVVHVDPAQGRVAMRHYERYVFGPVAGLFGRSGTLAIPVGLLAIDPDALLVHTLHFIESADARVVVRRNVAAAREERRVDGRRLP